VAGEILSARLNTLHNLYFYQNLMRTMREALAIGRFSEFAEPFLKSVAVPGREEESTWQI
jgi:queuine tRNA-ribosyltransferase